MKIKLLEFFNPFQRSSDIIIKIRDLNDFDFSFRSINFNSENGTIFLILLFLYIYITFLNF